MLRELGSALLLALAAPGSCDNGSDAAGAAGETSTPSPSTQCDNYADTWCNKALGCYVQLGRLDQDSLQTNVDECVQGTEARLPCASVTGVSADYDKCISQINGMSCSRWDVPQTQFGTVLPPASCNELFVF